MRASHSKLWDARETMRRRVRHLMRRMHGVAGLSQAWRCWCKDVASVRVGRLHVALSASLTHRTGAGVAALRWWKQRASVLSKREQRQRELEAELEARVHRTALIGTIRDADAQQLHLQQMLTALSSMIDATERAATQPSPLALPVSPQSPHTPTYARLVDRLSRPTISSLGGGGSSTSGSVTGSPEAQLQNASRAPTLKADVTRDLSAILNRLPESPMLNKHKLRTSGPTASGPKSSKSTPAVDKSKQGRDMHEQSSSSTASGKLGPGRWATLP